MKRVALNFLRVLVILGAVLIGSVPIIFSFLCGIFVASRNLAHSISFCFAASITIFSSAYPAAFRFGILQLRLHDSVTIADSTSFLPSLIWNLLIASVGAKAGSALRTGYLETTSSTAGNVTT